MRPTDRQAPRQRDWQLRSGSAACGVLWVLLSFCQRQDAPGISAAASSPSTAATPAAAPAAKAYDAYRQPEKLVAALRLKPGEQIAEIGAGGGYLTRRLAQAVGPGGRVVATDIDRQALQALKQRTEDLPQVEIRPVTAAAPGLEPGRYELILLVQVDHLLPDRLAYLRLLPPALTPTGRIALSNSVRYRQPLLEALTAAGFHVEEPEAGLPQQFLLIVHPSNRRMQ